MKDFQLRNFSEMGVDMYFDGAVSEQDVTDINIETTLRSVYKELHADRETGC